MAKIIIKSECEVYNGMPVTFKAPCACNAVDGLKVECGETAAEFTFRDAHGNDLTGIGNLFDKGAVVKAVLDLESGGAFVQNADTNAYLEGKFDEMVQSVNGQKGDVYLTADRIGAAASSVVDLTVTTVKQLGMGGDKIEKTLTAKLYTSGKLFALDIPTYTVGRWDERGVTDTIYLSNLPEGYRILEMSVEKESACNVDIDKDANVITAVIASSGSYGNVIIRVYGVVDGDAASGSGEIEPDWVQAVIDTANNAKSAAEEALTKTDGYSAALDAIATGLSGARADITALEQAQQGMSNELSTAQNSIAQMQQDISGLKENGGGGGAAPDLSKLEAVQGVEKVTDGDTVYIKGKAATSAELGMVKVTQENGVGIGSDGQLKVRKAEKQTISERKNEYQPIVPSMLEYAVQAVTHQQMGDKYYPDDVSFENGSGLPVSYAAVMNYINNLPSLGSVIIGATLEREE